MTPAINSTWLSNSSDASRKVTAVNRDGSVTCSSVSDSGTTRWCIDHFQKTHTIIPEGKQA